MEKWRLKLTSAKVEVEVEAELDNTLIVYLLAKLKKANSNNFYLHII